MTTPALRGRLALPAHPPELEDVLDRACCRILRKASSGCILPLEERLVALAEASKPPKVLLVLVVGIVLRLGAQAFRRNRQGVAHSTASRGPGLLAVEGSIGVGGGSMELGQHDLAMRCELLLAPCRCDRRMTMLSCRLVNIRANTTRKQLLTPRSGSNPASEDACHEGRVRCRAQLSSCARGGERSPPSLV